jgi:hypothetical protein
MVEISMSGSGEGPVWVTGRGYSTRKLSPGISGSTHLLVTEGQFSEA